MLKNAMVWPVSCGVAPGGVAKVVVTADCRSCRHPVGLPRDTCSLSIAQSICCHIWKNWWIVSAVNASYGMVGPVIWNGGRQRIDVGDARVGAERGGEPGAAGAEQELGLRRQARIAAGNAEDESERRRRGHAADVGRRQRRIKRLVARIGADEELA